MRLLVAVAMVAAACGDNSPPAAYRFCDSWHQWGNNPSHTGASCSSGQALTQILADVVIDQFAADEEKDTSSGDLVVHFQVPLIDGDDVFMMTKTGKYRPCLISANVPNCADPSELYRLNSEVWTEVHYTWQDGQLVEVWSFDSDWKPEPGLGFEPMFQPVIIGDAIAIPGAAGSIWLVDRTSGAALRRYTPFATNDTYVAGPITEFSGRLYYNVMQLDHDYPWSALGHAWLVAIDGDGTTAIADYQDLVPGAPQAGDFCYGNLPQSLQTFPDDPYPPPPPTRLTPPEFPCGRQMPGINTAPTFARDGTMYVVSHAQFNESYSYLVSVEATKLRTNWTKSLRDLLQDGCGVTVDCVDAAPFGVDPDTGLPPAAAVDDSASSTPVAMNDGTVLYGSLTTYNGERGHLLAFDRDGGYRGNYDFGWDTTPAVVGERIVLKDNNYFDGITLQSGPYNLTALDSSLAPIWKFPSLNTKSCERQPDGSVTCVDDHPRGFEWCINAPALDRDGTMFANSEDGNLYAITADGTLRDSFFLGKALGAAYTPIAIDHVGRIYALNAGHMYVVGEQ